MPVAHGQPAQQGVGRRAPARRLVVREAERLRRVRRTAERIHGTDRRHERLFGRRAQTLEIRALADEGPTLPVGVDHVPGEEARTSAQHGVAGRLQVRPVVRIQVLQPRRARDRAHVKDVIRPWPLRRTLHKPVLQRLPCPARAEQSVGVAHAAFGDRQQPMPEVRATLREIERVHREERAMDVRLVKAKVPRLPVAREETRRIAPRRHGTADGVASRVQKPLHARIRHANPRFRVIVGPVLDVCGQQVFPARLPHVHN